MARSHYESGEYEKALEVIQTVSFTNDEVSQGYGLVLFLQARAIKGNKNKAYKVTIKYSKKKAICYELIGDIVNAVQTYEGVESLIAEYSSMKCRLWAEWSETALYRAVLLGLGNE